MKTLRKSLLKNLIESIVKETSDNTQKHLDFVEQNKQQMEELIKKYNDLKFAQEHSKTPIDPQVAEKMKKMGHNIFRIFQMLKYAAVAKATSDIEL